MEVHISELNRLPEAPQHTFKGQNPSLWRCFAEEAASSRTCFPMLHREGEQRLGRKLAACAPVGFRLILLCGSTEEGGEGRSKHGRVNENSLPGPSPGTSISTAVWSEGSTWSPAGWGDCHVGVYRGPVYSPALGSGALGGWQEGRAPSPTTSQFEGRHFLSDLRVPPSALSAGDRGWSSAFRTRDGRRGKGWAGL